MDLKWTLKVRFLYPNPGAVSTVVMRCIRIADTAVRFRYGPLMTRSQTFSTLNKLSEYLLSKNIPINSWGTGTAKTIENLYEEILCGETLLVETESGVLRQICFAGILVTYQDGNTAYELAEDRQVFSDGRVRRRNKSQASVTEKMLPGESFSETAIRGLKEELGIFSKTELKDIGPSEEIVESASYPGLTTKYKRFNFSVQLTSDQYKAEGYKEIEKDKTTYFVWNQIT